MLERVEATILRYSMLPEGCRAGVAVSGGADSVCLLEVLKELAPRHGWRLEVAHFNHQLRGAESDTDERFVRELAGGLPFHRGSGDVRARGGNLEDAARRARREFLLAQGFDRVALGHTRDDQAETVLFRILRGAHTAGLAGILPVTREGQVRPLIEITRAEAREFLGARGIAWREDASNQDPRFARNRIRHELLPELRAKWNPQIDDALANLSAIARDEEQYWAAEVARIAGGREMEASWLRALPRAVARRVVRQAIREAKGDLRRIEFGHVEAVLALAERPEGRGRVSLPGLEVARSFDRLRLGKRGEDRADVIEVVAPGVYPAPDRNTQICLEVLETECARLEDEVDWQLVDAPLELRGWKAGDAYRPGTEAHELKLKELFQKARVPLWQRRTWPILSLGREIIWARQFGVSEAFAARGPGKVLRIREEAV